MQYKVELGCLKENNAVIDWAQTYSFMLTRRKDVLLFLYMLALDIKSAWACMKIINVQLNFTLCDKMRHPVLNHVLLAYRHMV